MKKLGIALILQCAATALAAADAFPERNVRIVVPAAAGSVPDVRARQVAGRLAERWGRGVSVDNRPGDEGRAAAREVLRAPADGHTLLLALVEHAIADVLKPDPCCRLNEALQPVSRFIATPLVLVAHPSLQVRSLIDYVAEAKKRQGGMSYAAQGRGSLSHLTGEWLQAEAGAELFAIHYKGLEAELADLLEGKVLSGFLAPHAAASALKAKRLRGLAVLGAERVSALPDIPTAREAGLPGLQALAWSGMAVAAGTPQSALQALHRDLVAAYTASEVREEVASAGGAVVADTPRQFAAFVRDEHAKWARVAREANLKLE